ncbi:MAG: DegV family protein [Firmicutes bacterium]|nr:DegV family protein [Bacillota bacterium]
MKNHKFIISTDTSADCFKSFLKENNVYCIIMKRIIDGKEIGELYDSVAEFEGFYDEIKKGALPTTTQLNSYELQAYFENIISKEKEGDIIHIPLSSGLSGSCENAKVTAEEINKNLSGRKIYVVDSLHATIGMTMLIHKLIEMRNEGLETLDAIKKIENIREHQQTWIIVSDLFHLKRGGRIGGVKATLGTLLNVKPILIISASGRLVIENKVKGDRKAVNYILDKVKKLGDDARPDFLDNPIYLFRTSANERYDLLKKEIKEKYPDAKIKESIVGPIIGTHLGCGCALISFEGAERIDIC